MESKEDLCPNCGSPLTRSEDTCPNCGARVGEHKQAAETQRETRGAPGEPPPEPPT